MSASRSRRRSSSGRRKGRPPAKRGHRVVWIKGHCRGRPSHSWERAERKRKAAGMPF